MRVAGLAAIVLAAFWAGAAHAETFRGGDLSRQVEALVQSLIGRGAPDRDVIAPPAGIDPQMALVPPRPFGTLRIITPPAGRRQR